MNKRMRSCIIMIIIIVLIFPFAVGVLDVLADMDIFKDIWIDVIEEIPFGNKLAEICLKFFTKSVSANIDVRSYLANSSQSGTAYEFMENICKLCLTAMLYDSAAKVGDNMLEISDKPKGWEFLEKTIWHMFSAFLCTIAAGLVLNFAFIQISHLVGATSGFWAIIILSIILLGAISVYSLLYSLGTGFSIIYVFIKFVVTSVLSVLLVYMLLLFMILCASEKSYRILITGGVSGALIITMIIAIEVMLSAVFEK